MPYADPERNGYTANITGNYAANTESAGEVPRTARTNPEKHGKKPQMANNQTPEKGGKKPVNRRYNQTPEKGGKMGANGEKQTPEKRVYRAANREADTEKKRAYHAANREKINKRRRHFRWEADEILVGVMGDLAIQYGRKLLSSG